jgi:hypothetical protein
VDWAELGDAAVSARVRVYCPDTRQYLKSDATWDTAGAAAVDVAARSTASWAASTLAFTAPTPTVWRAHVSLQLIAIAVEAAATGAAYVDDFQLRPSVDFIGFHGHNLGPVVVNWYASATGAFAGEETTVQAAVAVYPDRFYHHETTPSDLRYQRIILTGTNDAAGELGELTLSQACHLSESIEWGWDEERACDSLTEDVARSNFSLAWSWIDPDDREAFYREVCERSAWGRYPLWIVPNSDEPRVAFARIPTSVRDRRAFQNSWRCGGVLFSEEPYPVWR